jgi:hypothetical protein
VKLLMAFLIDSKAKSLHGNGCFKINTLGAHNIPERCYQHPARRWPLAKNCRNFLHQHAAAAGAGRRRRAP